MQIYRVLPRLERRKQLQLWQQALKNQWSALDLNWEQPLGLHGKKALDGLARVLTPVLTGEQAALYSVAALIPILGRRSEVEGQFYLTTWAVDEARHTELFARFYHRIGREPLSIRRFPQGYLFQSQIIAKEPAEWLAGVLVSEVLATQVMHEFRRLDLDPVLSEIADGILRDEARHLGFNNVYMEERFAEVFRTDPAAGEAYADRLAERLERVLAYVPPILEALQVELAALGVDREGFLARLREDVYRRFRRSVRAGAREAGARALS